MADIVDGRLEGTASVTLLVSAAGMILGGTLPEITVDLPGNPRDLSTILKQPDTGSFAEWWAAIVQRAATDGCQVQAYLQVAMGELQPVVIRICPIPGRDEYLVSYFREEYPHLALLDVLQRLYALSQQVTGQINSPDMLDMVVHTLHDIFQCRACVIALRDEDNPDELVIRAAVGIKEHWQKVVRWRVGDGVAGRVVATGQSFMTDDIYMEQNSLIFDPEVRSLIAVPVVFQGRIMGSLNLDSTQQAAFTAEHERILTIAAAQIAAALENARLYQEEAERAQMLAELNEALSQQEHLREELIQNLSHELRTPLTYVKGYVSLLLDGDLGPLDVEQLNALQIVADKAVAVQRLISDVVMLEDIGEDTLTREMLNINDLARRSFAALRLINGESTQLFHLVLADEAGLVHGDRSRLGQAIDNLLMNAVKYSPADATITLSTEVDQTAQIVRISVIDTGIGIAKADLARIFDRFYRVKDPASGSVSGSGIGLAIVRRIVEAHQGEIAVKSVKGEGSTFTITLPAVEGTAPDGG